VSDEKSASLIEQRTETAGMERTSGDPVTPLTELRFLSHDDAMIRIDPVAGAIGSGCGQLLAERWGACDDSRPRPAHQADELPGLIARIDSDRVGLATYRMEADGCELVSLDSLKEGIGVGSSLLAAVADIARSANLRRIRLVTTNDNLHAQRFYERRGMTLIALHEGAIAESRKLKPTIPEVGMDGMPIRDELEYELRLE
jgi:GNAT superfamily N-acetyltransferase